MGAGAAVLTAFAGVANVANATADSRHIIEPQRVIPSMVVFIGVNQIATTECYPFSARVNPGLLVRLILKTP